jgi:hypothetical protein
MSDKVKSQHIGRKALLYVRQSSTPKEQSVFRCWNQLETQTFSMPAQSEFGTL